MWCNENGRLYYAIAIGYVDFDPNLPRFNFKYTYDIDKGGELIVNGTSVPPSRSKRLLALNPFGEMEEVSLSPPDEDLVVLGDETRIWNDVVLKRLYRCDGRAEGGVLVGHWTYADADGRKAYEGSYSNGKRDGLWTYFYRNGNIRAEMSYKGGELDGQCKYFDANGKPTETVSWKHDFPVEHPVTEVGLGRSETRNPDRTSTASGS
jgi:hypothetical protein